MVPTPTWDSAAGIWRVDLRKPWKLGRHVIHGDPPPVGLIPAIHASYALLAELLECRPISAQLTLPGTEGRTFGAVLGEYLALRHFRTKGNERWVRETAATLSKRWRNTPLACFAPPQGTALLYTWKEECRPTEAQGPQCFGIKAMAYRLWVMRAILRFAVDPKRAYLPAMPDFPPPARFSGEPMCVLLDKWIDEATFRAARARIYEHPVARSALARELRRRGLPDGADVVHDIICRRKLFLSRAFYTGERKHDLEKGDDTSVNVALGVYWRFGRKTGVERAPESICPPFGADLQAEVARLGRPWRKGEAIYGGPWKNVCRVLARACDSAGVDRFNLMDCRRSFAWHKALAGVPEEDLVNLMGHKDSRMIRSIYLALQPRELRNRAGLAWPHGLSALPGTGPARVLAFPRRAKIPAQKVNRHFRRPVL